MKRTTWQETKSSSANCLKAPGESVSESQGSKPPRSTAPQIQPPQIQGAQPKGGQSKGGQSKGASLVTHVRRALTAEIQLPAGSGLVLGVSGGPDSVALLSVLARLASPLNFSLLAVSINHGLRPEAADEVRLVEGICSQLSVSFVARQVSVPADQNLQAAARRLRYEVLHQEASTHFGEHGFVVTAHHADDRGETVLLRLLRGVSVEGLNVLPPKTERRLRPMVRATKADVLAYLERHELPWVQDPSNRSSQFLRVRVRQELLPLLRALSPQIVDNLTTLADEAALLDEPLGLNREQRKQLRAALRDSSSVIDLPLGNSLRLTRVARSPKKT